MSKRNNAQEERKGRQNSDEVRISRLERRVLKVDARHEWIKNNNMK